MNMRQHFFDHDSLNESVPSGYIQRVRDIVKRTGHYAEARTSGLADVAALKIVKVVAGPGAARMRCARMCSV
jgi:hypothetical protein